MLTYSREARRVGAAPVPERPLDSSVSREYVDGFPVLLRKGFAAICRPGKQTLVVRNLGHLRLDRLSDAVDGTFRVTNADSLSAFSNANAPTSPIWLEERNSSCTEPHRAGYATPPRP